MRDMMADFTQKFVEDLSFYKYKCATCQNYDLTKPTGYGCLCNVHNSHGLFISPKGLAFDDSCNKYKFDRHRTIKDIKKAYEACDRKGGYVPRAYSAWYYIATAIKEILNNEISAECYQVIAQFRDEYLQKDLRYWHYLVSYDIYGYLIAEAIKKDDLKEEIASIVLGEYLFPICCLIKDEKYDAALELYITMVKELKSLFEIPAISEYDYTKISALTADDLKRIRRPNVI